jgi:Na+/H+ antiporter NhaD/arsenite permease-like protein
MQQTHQQYIALAIFVVVYALIIWRRRVHIPIWMSMVTGAFLMLIFQIIPLESAFKSINLDVIGFLFGMFSIVTALDRSGVLKLLAIWILSRAKDLNTLLMVFIVRMGILSAFLVNKLVSSHRSCLLRLFLVYL